MDIKNILQDAQNKKFLIAGIVVFFAVVSIIFFLTRTPNVAQTNNDQLLSDLAKLAPRDSLSQTTDRLNTLPIVTLSADATAVAPGQPSVISWTSPNATECVDSNGNALLTTGSLSISPEETYSMDIFCTNAKGTTVESLTIEVTTEPIITISASPKAVEKGKQSLISWSTVNATRCTDIDGKALRLSGSLSIAPKTPYIFEIICTGPNGTSKKSITVAIALPQVTQKTSTTTPVTTPIAAVVVSTTTKSVVIKTATTGVGKAKIALSVSLPIVKYGEKSTVAWGTENAKMCTATTPTGVEIINKIPGEPNIILRPGDQLPTPPASLPVTGAIDIKVLDGQKTATLKIQCTDADGNKTERSITVTGLAPAPDFCKTFKNSITHNPAPEFKLSPSSVSVPAGGTSDVSWNATCATQCTVNVVPWGKLITYTDVSTILDYIIGEDYNTYTPTHGIQNLAVSSSGGVRIYPGQADPDTPVAPSESTTISNDSTVTLKCTNSSGDTPYSTTASLTVSVIVLPPGASCATVLCDVIDFASSFVSDVGGFIADLGGW